MEELYLISNNNNNAFVFSKIVPGSFKITYSSHKINTIESILTQISNKSHISTTIPIVFTIIRSSFLNSKIKQLDFGNSNTNHIRHLPINKLPFLDTINISNSIVFLNTLQLTEESLKPSDLDFNDKNLMRALCLSVYILFFVTDTPALMYNNKDLLKGFGEYLKGLSERNQLNQTRILNTERPHKPTRKITLAKRTRDGYLQVSNQTLHAMSVKKQFKDTILTNITPLYKTEYYLPCVFREQLMLKTISNHKLQTRFIQPSLKEHIVTQLQEAVQSLQMNPSIFNELKALYKRNMCFMNILTLKINEELKLDENRDNRKTIMKGQTNKNWFNLYKTLEFSVNLILILKNFPVFLDNLEFNFIERLSYITKCLKGIFNNKFNSNNKKNSNKADNHNILSEFIISSDAYKFIVNTENEETSELSELLKQFTNNFNQLFNLKAFLNSMAQPKLNNEIIKISKDLNCRQYNFIFIPQFGFYVLFGDINKAYKFEICKKLDEEIGDIYVICVELQELILMELYEIFVQPYLYNTIRKIFKFIIKCDIASAITQTISIKSYDRCEIENIHTQNVNVNLTKFGHPLIENEYCVKNEIVLNGGDVVVIAGPNGSGKTTWGKSILSNIMLSYAIGFGNYGSCKIANIKSLKSVIELSGDTKNIKCFKDDLKAIKKVIEEVKDGSKGTVYFIDEFGKGTDPKDGASLFCSVVNYLSDLNSNNIFIFVTNFLDMLPSEMFFESVKLLEMETEVTENENKDMIFKYKATKYGESISGGLTIARLFFGDDIIKRAEQIKMKSMS